MCKFIFLPLFALIVLLLALASATKIFDCKTGQYEKNFFFINFLPFFYLFFFFPIGNILPDEESVKLENCEPLPCKLRRGTSFLINQQFTAPKDTNSLTVKVWAKVLGAQLPFPGIDGTSACDKIANLDGTPAGCKLREGQRYNYKHSFPILAIYPTV